MNSLYPMPWHTSTGSGQFHNRTTILCFVEWLYHRTVFTRREILIVIDRKQSDGPHYDRQSLVSMDALAGQRPPAFVYM